MEETAIPLHSWFWLIVPMSIVFLLSIVNYFRNRYRGSEAEQNNSRNDAAGNKTASGKDPATGK